MPEFLEQKLKAEYGAHSAIPYKIMNKIGALRGSKITPKGREMQRKHDRDRGGGAGRHPRGRLALLMGKR